MSNDFVETSDYAKWKLENELDLARFPTPRLVQTQKYGEVVN